MRLVTKAGTALAGIELIQRKPVRGIKYPNIIERVIECPKGCTADNGKEERFGLRVVEATRVAKGERIAQEAGPG